MSDQYKVSGVMITEASIESLLYGSKHFEYVQVIIIEFI